MDHISSKLYFVLGLSYKQFERLAGMAKTIVLISPGDFDKNGAKVALSSSTSAKGYIQ